VKTIVYIDGFNLYYGSLKGTGHKWLDLCAYFERTLPAGHTLEKIKYFTARVSPVPGKWDAPRRQDVYLRALRAHSKDRIEVIEGHFLTKNVKAPRTAPPHHLVEVIRAEEKGSDVNIAVEMINDCWQGNFECAALVSNDGDLERALRIVKQQLKRRVILYTPGAPKRQPLACLRKWSHKQIGVVQDDLPACQLPTPIPETVITKPSEW
jgi:hypothetical protein